MIKILLIPLNAQKGVKKRLFEKWGGILINHNPTAYKVKFILKILIIYFMNIYLLALLLASLDTYLCYKKFLINRNDSKPILLLIFLMSFYLIIVILELLRKFI